MEKSIQINRETREYLFIKRIKKYQVITFTFGFLFLYHLTTILVAYFTDKNVFLEKFDINIWFWVIGIPVIYFLQWLLVVWIAIKLPTDKLKQIFLRHPIATIILLILYTIDLPYRLANINGGCIVNIFETIVYYAFISFLWWLFICWISNKIIKKQRFHWYWYQKVIEKIFIFMPITYKIILSLIVAFILFIGVYILLSFIFKYSGQDLKILLS